MTHQNRKTRAAIAALLLSAALTATASAADAPRVDADGAVFEGNVLLVQNTTYIPMRDFFTFWGWQVQWDGSNATAAKGGTTLSVSSARRTLTVGSTTLEAEILVRQERIYLPLRTTCALLEHTVTWDGARNTASVRAGGTDWPEDTLYWLSRIICAEAGGESLTGQVAVGNVVLNRVASGEFPDSVYGVVFDRKDAVQFEPVQNGTVYNAPTAQSVQAAQLALRGANTAGGSLYFFNPALSGGAWIRSHRSYYKTIGCHQFYL